jgi:hypothetical protein
MCSREMRRFPDDQFSFDEDFGWIHTVEPRHTTDGLLWPAKPGTFPGVPYIDRVAKKDGK